MMREGAGDGTGQGTRTEERLTVALQARTELITRSTTRPLTLPAPALEGARRRWLVPSLAAAASVVVVTAALVVPHLSAGSGALGGGSGPQVSSTPTPAPPTQPAPSPTRAPRRPSAPSPTAQHSDGPTPEAGLARNLPVTAALLSVLRATYIQTNKLPAAQVAGPDPRTVRYSYQASTDTYWAYAEYEHVGPTTYDWFDDGGTQAVYTKRQQGPWTETNAGVPWPCAGEVPQGVLDAWNVSLATGCADTGS